MRLDVIGDLVVDGTLESNGTPGSSGGGAGSGGGIRVDVSALSGAGTIAADGAVGGASGGGGRVALYFDAADGFSGKHQACAPTPGSISRT